MHEHDCDVEAALQIAQVREQRRDLAGQILVDAMQADKRIEDGELGAQLGDRRGERAAVELDIEPHGRRDDDVDVEVVEPEAGDARDAG
jgi:hypothetical protein